MSFLSDLLEGNTGNLWTDIEHAPSSLAAHPEQIAELAAGAGAVALPLRRLRLGWKLELRPMLLLLRQSRRRRLVSRRG